MVGDLHRVVREARRVLKPGGAFLFYEHAASRKGFRRHLERRLNPAWRLLTTGCNLDRDIGDAIKDEFHRVEVDEFDLSVGFLLTIPNIVGVART